MMAESFFDWLLHIYDSGLKKVLKHQPLMIVVLFATMAVTGYLYVTIPKGFFPQQDNGFILGFSEAAQDVSFAAMAQHQQALAAIVSKDPAIDNVAYSAGATGGAQTENTGRFWITLKPRDERDVTADQVINRLRPQLEKVEGVRLFLQANQDINVGGRVSRTQYQYTLQDANLTELNEWAPKVLAKLKTLPGLQDVASVQPTQANTVTMTIDRDTAARFGIQPQLIDDTLYDAFGQRQVAQYFTQLDQYNVVLEVDPSLQADPSTLDKIYVKSPTNGRQVPLSAFIRFDSTQTNYLSIAHQGQFPAVTLSFNLAPGMALGDAIVAIQKANEEINTPTALIGSFQGTAEAFQSSLASQPYLILAAIITVYIILGVLYESYIHPITILSTLPSAGLGALLILMVGGYDLSVIALIGILLLIGIVKKNAIMMIDFALDAERRQGMSPEESIYQACLLRFRPIMMTTMAALLGGLPLMLSSGTGSEIRRPLGFAIVGGLLVSQVLTLYTTPVVYLYMDRLHRWLTGEKEAGHHAQRLSTAQRVLAAQDGSI
jgi:HAE1 family hydrophobic/amphiphilic exporter-1/multidrug efflux pump